MPKTQGPNAREQTPAELLDSFLVKFPPEIAAFAAACLERMRARLPGALQLVYDNYNALAIGFGPSERASEAVFSIAVYPRWVSLFFLQGAGLPDPDGVLKGGGKLARHVVLRNPDEIDAEPIRKLMERALNASARPLASAGGRIIIKSVSAKQRPRRPSAPPK